MSCNGVERLYIQVYTRLYPGSSIASQDFVQKKKTGTGKRSFNLLDLSYFKFEIITIFYTMASSF